MLKNEVSISFAQSFSINKRGDIWQSSSPFRVSIKLFTNLLISEFAVIAESESVPSPIPTGLLQSDGKIEAYIDLIRRMNIRFFVKCKHFLRR